MTTITNPEKVAARRTTNRIGLLLGTVALFWSAQLLAKDKSFKAGKRDESDEPPRRVLVISIPDRKLALTEEGRVLKIYAVAVGASVSPSPTGRLKIITKVAGPTYYHKGKVIPPGESNPLGDRWMGLSKVGYGIHGTNVPGSIGKAASHGCFRMGKHDVEDLFSLVRVGDAVEIHGERDAQLAEIFGDPAPAVLASAQTVAPPAPGRTTDPLPAVMTAMAEQ